WHASCIQAGHNIMAQFGRKNGPHPLEWQATPTTAYAVRGHRPDRSQSKRRRTPDTLLGAVLGGSAFGQWRGRVQALPAQALLRRARPWPTVRKVVIGIAVLGLLAIAGGFVVRSVTNSYGGEHTEF